MGPAMDQGGPNSIAVDRQLAPDTHDAIADRAPPYTAPPRRIAWQSTAIRLFILLLIGRLLGAELGAAFVQTFVRVREQAYSNLIGLHVTGGAMLTDQRLQDYAYAVLARSIGASEASARGVGLLALAVQTQAYVLRTPQRTEVRRHQLRPLRSDRR